MKGLKEKRELIMDLDDIIQYIKSLHFYFEDVGIMDEDMWCKFDDAEKALKTIYQMIL